jgi:hypothetical protein
VTADELVGMVDELTLDRIFAIETAYAAAGFPHPKYAITAAKQAGRMEEVTEALRRMAFGVQMYGLLNDVDTRGIVEAAKNVGVGLVTEDLIGKTGYSVREYGQLVDPWFKGFTA